ncbi:MAG: hypothetical protein BGO10_08095 [Chlamydia sp. 32-24]|nr:MAG: hypothetical protein BGO10_08095 [Chlamydia sp. 32-24]
MTLKNLSTKIFQKIKSTQSLSLLTQVSKFTLEKQLSFIHQIEKIDLRLIKKQQKVLKETNKSLCDLKPINFVEKSGKISRIELGKKVLKQGKVGCLVVAGGQGTRLGSNAPKGFYPITICKQKSLFQLLCEKILAASIYSKHPLPLAIMTSPKNFLETKNFFKAHNYFGLEENQVSFFVQDQLPYLSDEGSLIIDSDDNLALAPDGNGKALHKFWQSGLGIEWEKKGIEYVNFILIDNVLADPFDIELLGIQQETHAEIAVKVIPRISKEEKVGVIGKIGKKIKVVEYSEIDKTLEENEMIFHYANISCFLFTMSFIKKISLKTIPLHKQLKPVDSKLNGYKFEYYIFDVIPFATKVAILEYPRWQTFAPLKNKEGNDSVKIVQKSVLEREKKILAAVIKKEVMCNFFELDPQFYYPTDELIQFWKGKTIQPGYVPSFKEIN